MKPLWNYKDIFDLEYFLHKDSTARTDSLSRRDREIYLHHIEPSLSDGDAGSDSRLILRQWLEHRRRTEFGATDSLSPGALFVEAQRTLRLICLVAGLFFGSLIGLGFFNYAGTTPINIFSFLVFFILSQILILGGLLLSGTLRHLLRRRIVTTPLLIRLMADLLTRIILWGHRNILGRMWAESRDSLTASLGLLKGAQRTYGSLFHWPAFILLQVLGIGMNGGILAATLFRILTSDIAFGWQSTVQFGAEALHRLVVLISLPWSWLFPEDVGYPSLAAIEGSRIILKEGIAGLATSDLISWWPFLVLCLLVYGLLPRIVLYCAGLVMQHRGLSRLRFSHPPCTTLLQRMLTPKLSTQAAPELRPQAQPAPGGASANGNRPLPITAGRRMLLLIPDDIYPALKENDIKELLDARGFSAGDTIRIMESYEADREILADLQQRDWSGDCGVLILMESWMPPLVAFLSFLGEIRSAIGPEAPIVIELLGRPGITPAAPVIPEGDWLVWTRKITALGDPFTSLAPLRTGQP
jgi:hypothetical protein